MFYSIRLLATLCLCMLGAGCATSSRLAPPPPPAELFSDAAFRPASRPVRADQLFALSAPMRDYLHSSAFQMRVRQEGADRGLVDALYKKGDLKLEYDATITRDAAETFAAKQGNCLSLVIMTAAFAKELGLDVRFNSVLIDQQWSRSGGIYFSSTHVNLSLAVPRQRLSNFIPGQDGLTIDFLPPADLARYHTRTLSEEEIVAMFLNNRAAEELAERRLDEAYWWARAAVEKDPGYIAAYNTLGVIYRNHGDNLMAERVYRAALARAPEDVMVMNNMVPVLAALGKTEESKALAVRVAGIEPTPPFHYFELGVKAMKAGQYAEAKAQFAREVRRSPYYHEFHFWLAVAHLRLGEEFAARKELALAVDTSTRSDSTQLYSSKLAYLRSRDQGKRHTY